MKVILIGLGVSMLLLAYLLCEIPVIKADLVSPEGFTIAYKPYIVFPSNYNTYHSKSLTLNVSFHAMIFADTNYSMTYSLDGKENESLPLVEYYFGSWIIDKKNWERNHIDGSVILPELSEGAHRITVYLENIDSQTVYFSILLLDKTPPNISNLSVENKTYTSTDIPLDFNINETASQISYSLDNLANVTINGNTTLTGLVESPHSLTVYANDTAGNMGATETIYFNIEVPKPSSNIQQIIAAASGGSIAFIGIGVLVYFRKRKH